MPKVVMVVMVSIFCSCGNQVSANQSQTTTDSVVEESTEADRIDPTAAKEFLESMYKTFYEPYNMDRNGEKLLCKYFVAEAMQKFYVESDYEEGDFFPDFGDASPCSRVRLLV